MECCVCKYKMHLQCISISRNEYDELMSKSDDWICSLCFTEILPFNHYEDDTNYCDALMDMFYGIDHFSVRFQEKIFEPFELTDFEKRFPIFDIDPDLHFFYINRDMFQISKYYMEDPFIEKCRKVFKNECFSMIHMNIRSLPANLNHFMSYLNCLNVQFSVLCFSETWLNANNCDLYALPGYSHVGKHHPRRFGGGVSLFIKECFTYKSRLDISIYIQWYHRKCVCGDEYTNL